MHGQDRSEYKARLRDEATVKKLGQKAQQWNLLSSELLKRRRDAKKIATALSATTVDDATDEHLRCEGEGAIVGGSTATSRISTALETLKLTEKLLSVNPDPAYLWNHRMELLLFLTTDDTNDGGDQTSNAALTPAAFIKREQEMTTTCLQRNPKAYGAWFHRKWAIQHWMQTVRRPHDDRRTLLEIELQRCVDLLNLDERNFHCWSYRRFVVAALAASVLHPDADDPGVHGLDGSWTDWCHLADGTQGGRPSGGSLVGAQIVGKRRRAVGVPVDARDAPAVPHDPSRSEDVLTILRREWNFTTEKIYQNFSNGSAFHHRSKLLPLLYPDASCTVRPELLHGELELVQNAVYTEPDDQTAWWYLRFVLDWANPDGPARAGAVAVGEGGSLGPGREEEEEAYVQVLKEQFECVRGLVETEEGRCKWGLLGMNMIATILYRRTGKGGEDSDNRQGGYDWRNEAYGCLEALEMLDPDRAVRYKSMMERYD